MRHQAQERLTAALPRLMKAVQVHAYGGPDRLVYEDVSRPEPGPGETLVRVRAAGVNPVDWKIRQGLIPGLRLPLIPGWDFSGVVEETGGQGRFSAGDEVISRPDLRRNGAYAEYIVVRHDELAAKPRSVDHIAAAGLSLAGLTAWQALFDHGHLQPGQRVLIHAAAGGVGMIAVQLAKWKGAHVIGTASRRNESFVLALGADEFIDYTSTRPEDAVRNIDLVIDTVGHGTGEASLITLKKGGTLVSIVEPPPSEKAHAVGVRTAHFMAETRVDQLADLSRLVDDRRLELHVGQVLPLSEARKAHEISESRHLRGKIVLRVS